MSAISYSKALLSPNVVDFSKITKRKTATYSDQFAYLCKLGNAISTGKYNEISSGFVSDMAYISLAYGLLCAGAEEKHTRKGDYKTDKQLDRRLEALKDELYAFMSNYSYIAHEAQTKGTMLCNKLFGYVEYKNPQVDYLACYVLKFRFMPLRKRLMPLHDDFKWIISKKGQLHAILELLDKTKAVEKEELTAEIAYNLSKEL